MKTIVIPPLRWYHYLFDKLIVPIMFVLRGFRFDSLQETHVWHVHSVSPKDIDLKMAVPNKGTDESRFMPGNDSFLFHAPIFGGWKNFSVYEVDVQYTPFHIGWAGLDVGTGKLSDPEINLLPIYGNQIRMLDGPLGLQTYFFAFNNDGCQIPLKKIGHGRLGDSKYLSTQLF